MSWFKKLLPKLSASSKKRGVPEGLWNKCTGCEAVLYSAELERHLFVCPKCQFHMRINARQRLNFFLDPENQEEIGQKILPEDRLRFRDSKKYKDRLSAAQKETDETEALIVMKGRVRDLPLIVAVFEFKFIGGSMS